jgi:hypothetical protein
MELAIILFAVVIIFALSRRNKKRRTGDFKNDDNDYPQKPK